MSAGVDRDVRLLCQIVEDKTVLPERDRPQERPVRKGKTNMKSGDAWPVSEIRASVRTRKRFVSFQKSCMVVPAIDAVDEGVGAEEPG